MHDIKPWSGWQDEYKAEKDKKSPFYGNRYDEFQYTTQIYNYYIDPHWDFIGSETLYGKLLYVSYSNQYAILELIGEWNDAIGNDIMFLKRDIADIMVNNGINKFLLICDNVLNFHADEDSYYEEWYNDIKDDGGWICLINTFDHVLLEMNKYRLGYYMHFGYAFNDVNWRGKKPSILIKEVENLMQNSQKSLF